MNVVVVFAIIAIVLFAAAYTTKRRFGILGLALAAGSILSTLWSFDAGLVVGAVGIFPPGQLTTAITLSLIVLLPSIILLFHGHSYKSFIGRFVGALLFTILGLAFLVVPLGGAFALSSFGANTYAWLVQYRQVIISAGLVVAVLDLFITKQGSSLEHHSKR